MNHIEWWRAPGSATAHAFVNGPGLLRSICRAVTWSASAVPALRDPWLCPQCLAGATRLPAPAMTEGEAREAFGR